MAKILKPGQPAPRSGEYEIFAVSAADTQAQRGQSFAASRFRLRRNAVRATRFQDLPITVQAVDRGEALTR